MERVPIRPPSPPPRGPAEGERLALRFQRGFLAGQRLSALPWQDLEKILRTSGDSSPVLTILQETVFHPLCMKYPPSVKYRKCFLLELIKKHESTGAESLDPLYEALGEVLTAKETTHCYKSYLLPSGDAVTLRENVAIISQGTTGLVTWDAGLYLAEWALQNPSIFCNRNILELGSGIGLTGIVVCKACGPKTYTFSDHHPCVLQQLSENIRLNGFFPETEACICSPEKSTGQEPGGPNITVAEIDWDQVKKERLAELGADVVIAADVVYDPELIRSLIGVLQKLSMGNDGGKAPEVYIAFAIRNPETYHCFQAELAKVGIAWQTVPGPQKNLFSYDQHANICILRLLI
uniref:Protein-lysine N-methyltransferase EEF2KMT n=1 Tax=Pogona vitticeps TaxID=103695 RepID=A0A6J0ULK2_9SAUR